MTPGAARSSEACEERPDHVDSQASGVEIRPNPTRPKFEMCGRGLMIGCQIGARSADGVRVSSSALGGDRLPRAVIDVRNALSLGVPISGHEIGRVMGTGRWIAEAVGGAERVQGCVRAQRLGVVDERRVDHAEEQATLAGVGCNQSERVRRRHLRISEVRRPTARLTVNALMWRKQCLLDVVAIERSSSGYPDAENRLEPLLPEPLHPGRDIQECVLVDEAQVVVDVAAVLREDRKSRFQEPRDLLRPLQVLPRVHERGDRLRVGELVERRAGDIAVVSGQGYRCGGGPIWQ